MSSSTSRSVPALSQVSRNDFDFPSSSSSSSLLPSSSEHHRTPLRQFDTPHRGRYSLVTTLRSTSKHREPSAFHPPHLSFVQCELQVESALAVLTAEAAAAAERAAATTPITNGSIAGTLMTCTTREMLGTAADLDLTRYLEQLDHMPAMISHPLQRQRRRYLPMMLLLLLLLQTPMMHQQQPLQVPR